MIQRVKKYLQTLNTIASEVSAERKRLEQEHRDIESHQEDLLHEIELAERINAYDGYRLYAELRMVRRKRRQIKNDLEALLTLSSITSAKEINNARTRIGNIERKIAYPKYKPRIRKDLRFVEQQKQKAV